MTLHDYELVKSYDYSTYCKHLLEKYGAVGGDYFMPTFSQNMAIKRTDEGLYIHHIDEDKVANLSNYEVAKANLFDYQRADRLVYADLFEHILLHILIGEQNKGLGFGGAEIMLAQANDMIWSDEERDVLNLLKERCRNSINAYETLLTHNQTVFFELIDTLDKHGLAFLDLGPGLGKTTTALACARRYGVKALVLGPNITITKGWAGAEDADPYTYAWFMNNYKNIDYTKYGVLVCDEAHHLSGKRWREGVEYVKQNKLLKIIGLTGTPNKACRDFFEDRECKGFSILDGIEREIIHDFSYIGAIYDTSDIKEKYADISDKALLGELDLALNNTPTVKTIITKHMPSNKRKGIIFVSNIAAIGEAEEIMRDIYPNAEYRRMHSLMPDNEVRETREWFQNTDEGYLLAVNMISEGAHYKGVNTIIMFRRTQSSLVFNQQLGRIITLARDEDPHAIVFDLVNNAENLDTEKGFSASLRESYAQRKARGGKEKSEQIIVEDYAEAISDVLRKIAEATSRFWTESEKEILKQYYAEHSEGKIDLTGLLPLLPRHNKTQIINQASFLGITNNKRIPWASEEDEILKQNYSIIGTKVSELLPNRSIQSILQRANGLGLKYETNKWTEEELDIIHSYFPTEGIVGVEKRLPNRTRKSIQTKASDIGVKMNNPNGNRRGQGHKRVMCIETGIIYDSIAEASRFTGISSAGICESCKYSAGLPSRQKAAGKLPDGTKLHWKYVD